MNKTSLPSPCYILEEDLLRRNLTLIRDVAQRAGVEIILAFKAYALWKTFPIIREYVPHSTASSIYEAQLAYEEMGAKAHTFSPAYTREEFPTILRYSSHVTFNSLSHDRADAPSDADRWERVLRAACQPRVLSGGDRPV